MDEGRRHARRRWVVTGPTGAGKSLFTAGLARHGAEILDADRLGHEVLTLEAVKDAVRGEFGDGVFRGEVVDRRALGRIVFADADALARLNTLVHPALAARIGAGFAAMEHGGGGGGGHGKGRLAVLEAAVYFLLPSIAGIDLVICVTASAEIRHGRLVAEGLAAREAAARITAQRRLEDGWTRADVTFVNDGDRSLMEQAAVELLREHGLE